jgi:hypothetical protein
MIFLKKIVCFFLGHVAEPYFTDSKTCYYEKRCSFCHSTIGLSHLKLYNMPPPYSSEIRHIHQDWNKSVDKFIDEIKVDIQEQREKLGLEKQ